MQRRAAFLLTDSRARARAGFSRHSHQSAKVAPERVGQPVYVPPVPPQSPRPVRCHNVQTMKHLALILVLLATPAFAQVQVDARLEKAQYLAGEPIVVVVDILNVGDEAVGYSRCDGDVTLTVIDVARRVLPNIVGCGTGIGFGSGRCGVDHPPLLAPGQRTSFNYVLREYDLGPGQYSLVASGKARVRHRDTDPVPGAQFERTLSFTVVPGTDDELKRSFDRYISGAHGSDPVRRFEARAAIVENPHPFLAATIARIAEVDVFDQSAIDALGRIGNAESRSDLKTLFHASAAPPPVLNRAGACASWASRRPGFSRRRTARSIRDRRNETVCGDRRGTHRWRSGGATFGNGTRECKRRGPNVHHHSIREHAIQIGRPCADPRVRQPTGPQHCLQRAHHADASKLVRWDR